MKIAGLQKLTLLDYPTKTACTVFTAGCNFCCPFCHNSPLIPFDAEGQIPEEEFFAFLAKRKGLLDGVCISGGEPLLQNDIVDFCRRIKSEGFLLKLDTNGSLPDRLLELVSAGLVDYIAMDLKNSEGRYGETVGIENFDISPIKRSIEIIRSCGAEYEFRTTVAAELHDEKSLTEAAQMIEGADKYFIQSFKDSENVTAKYLHPHKKCDLEAFKEKTAHFVKKVELRGV